MWVSRSQEEMDFVLRYSFLLIPITAIGQAMFIGMPGNATMISGGLVMLGALLPLMDVRRALRLLTSFSLV